jgi:membrane-associated phospholipid phosphatase
MPLVSILVIWRYKKPDFEKFSFIILNSYYIYYLIFVIIPAEGPQFYLPSPLNQIEAQGIFGYLIKWIQSFGEAPTAAFPSSHIGISLILLILLFKRHKTLFIVLLPFCFTLVFSTIYIKAHYFVDVVGGVVSAPAVLLISNYIYHNINNLSFKLVYGNRN